MTQPPRRSDDDTRRNGSGDRSKERRGAKVLPLPSSRLDGPQVRTAAEALHALFARFGPLLPDDPELLSFLNDGELPAHAWRSAINNALRQHTLRRIFIGDEAHLAPRQVHRPADHDASDDGHAAAEDTTAEDTSAKGEHGEDVHQLEVEIDIQRERLVLYRGLAVLGSVGLALFAREALIVWLEHFAS